MKSLDRTVTIKGRDVRVRVCPEAPNGYVVQAFFNNSPISRRFLVEAESMADLSHYTGLDAVEELAALAEKDATVYFGSTNHDPD